MKTLTIRVPEDVHDQSREVLQEIGLDVATAFRLFLTQVAVTRSIPFPLKAREVSLQEVPVDKPTQASMDEVAALWSRKTKTP